MERIEFNCSTGEKIAIQMTQEEIDALPKVIPPSLSQQAQPLLDKVTSSSGTIMRCVAAGVAVPAEWSAYVAALRLIAAGKDTASTALPVPPDYPAGT